MNQTEAFHRRIDEALHNDQLRRNFRTALSGIQRRREEQFPDDPQLQALREQARAVRANALTRQPELLERLEAKLTANGIQVHWAETAAEANQLVLDIMQSHGATRLVKGKSMVSEEMELNAFLQKHGIEALEKIMTIKRELPVVIHSAYSHYKENYLTWSAMAYVVKSGNLDELIATVEKLIHNT